MANTQSLQPLQNDHFGSNLKLQKKCQKPLNPDYSCSMQKTAPRNDEYSTNGAILKTAKNGQYAKATAFGNYHSR